MTDALTPQVLGIQPELLTLPQAAALCGLGTRTLARYSTLGLAPQALKLRAGKQGASRYRRSDLLRWIESGCMPIREEGSDQ